MARTGADSALSGLASPTDRLLAFIAAVHLGLAGFYALGGWPSLPGLALSPLLVALSLATAWRLELSVRRMQALFVFLAAFEVVGTGTMVGWSPEVALGAYFITLLAGLLVGWQGAALVWSVVATAMVVGAVAVAQGFRVHELAGKGSPEQWLLSGLLFVGGVAALGWQLRTDLRSLAQGHAATEGTLDQLGREIERLRLVREQREAGQVVLERHQRLHALTQLSGGVRHLLDNTLMVVNAAVHELDASLGEERLERVVSEVGRSVQLAARNLRSLLVFTREEEPTETIELSAAVAPVLDTLRATVPTSLEIRDLIPEGLQVRLGVQGLHQLVTNLVLNSRDALAGASGRVTLTAEIEHVYDPESVPARRPPAPGRYVRLEVHDTGPGFSSTARVRGTDPFFGTRGRDEHLGLGLFVCAGLAQRWGGAIGLGGVHGATVYVWLPLEEDGGPALPTEEVVRARDSLEQWRVAAARRAALLTAGGFAVVVVAQLLLGAGNLTPQLFIGPLAVLVNLAAGLASGLSARSRALAPVATLWLIGSASILLGGLMIPAGHMVLATAALLLAIYGERNDWLFGLAAGALVYAVGSVWGPLGGPDADLHVRPDRWQNWLRIDVTTTVVMTVNSILVLDVIATGTQAVRELGASRRALVNARSELREEVHHNRQLATATSRLEPLGDLGRLAGGVAHDLNNLLGLILARFELLTLPDTLSAAEVESAVAALERSTQAAVELVDQLVGERPEGRVLDLAGEIGWLLPQLQRRAGRQVQVTLSARSGCLVRVPLSDLERVLASLVSNAVDAMPDGGVVQLLLRLSSEEVLLQVVDDGIGMDAETVACATQPFFTTKEREQGTGLGLFAVGQVMRRSEGTLEVHSAPGRGTTIELRWPVAPPDHSAPVAAAPRSPWTRGGRLLLAEDDDQVQRVLERVLAGAGFEVTVAGNGDEALALLDEGPWCAMVTDGVMPGTPTTEVVEVFQDRFPGVPVVLVSGYLAGVLGALAEREGVTFIAKPFYPTQLLEVLHRLLSLRDSLDDAD